jgi:hypothetical protein
MTALCRSKQTNKHKHEPAAAAAGGGGGAAAADDDDDDDALVLACPSGEERNLTLGSQPSLQSAVTAWSITLASGRWKCKMLVASSIMSAYF